MRSTRAAARLAYYAWDVSGLPRGSIRFSVDVRGTPRSIVADAGNRQYNVLYFQKYRHAYEPEVSTIISTLLPHDGVLYDVGSNWGYFCLMVASSPEFTGHCHAFEPFPSTYGDLADVVRQAGLEPFGKRRGFPRHRRLGRGRREGGRHGKARGENRQSECVADHAGEVAGQTRQGQGQSLRSDGEPRQGIRFLARAEHEHLPPG